jgi:hypothetical protein
MSKDTLFNITNKLNPLIVKDTRYSLAILVEVQLACVIYKLFYSSHLLTYNELFVISKSTSGLVIWKVVKTINVVFKNLVWWLVRQKTEVVMLEFKHLCNLLNVHDAINAW